MTTKASHPRRAWINQPSTLQPLHSRNGENVLAVPDFNGGDRCYPLSGPIISFHAPAGCLSDGWIVDTPRNV